MSELDPQARSTPAESTGSPPPSAPFRSLSEERDYLDWLENHSRKQHHTFASTVLLLILLTALATAAFLFLR